MLFHEDITNFRDELVQAIEKYFKGLPSSKSFDNPEAD